MVEAGAKSPVETSSKLLQEAKKEPQQGELNTGKTSTGKFEHVFYTHNILINTSWTPAAGQRLS